MKRSARDNKNLSNYIRQSLQVERFGEPFSTLLVEAFVRMQYVLDLSPSEIKEDISNFANSTWNFRFDKLPENTMGWSDPNRHEIVFNIDYWQNVMNRCSENEYTVKFFETFSHECLHGMQEVTTNNGSLYNRAGGYNKKTNNRSHAIYEICTQATAAKMARNRQSNEFEQGIILAGDGYSDEIFAVSLIASTFGITEQEVLKYGMRERDKLVEALDKNIGNREYTARILDKIEDELEMIHSIGYPDDNQKKFKQMPDKQKSELKTKSILELTNLCQNVFATRIQNMPIDVNNKTITAYKFDQKKMLDTLSNEFLYYGYGLDKSYNEMYYMSTEFGSNAIYIKRSLNVLSDLAKDKQGIFSKYRTEIIDCVKRDDFDSLSRYGMNIEREATVYLASHDIEMREKKIHKDYNSLIDWDNSDLQDILYRRQLRSEQYTAPLYLKNWNEERINGYEGSRKLCALEKAARTTAKVHEGKDIRYTLFKFLKSNPREYESSVYNNITRKDGARAEFSREFATDSDKEFLVKIIAQRYLEQIYDFDRGVLKARNSKNIIEDEIKNNLLPTIQKYGKEHTMWAIAKTILEGNYNSISNGQIHARKNLELISPESFLDVVSEPLMNELMQKRETPENLKKSVIYSIFRTNEKYPGTIGNRIAAFVDEFNRSGNFQYTQFTGDGRQGLIQNITCKEDLKSMIGMICDDFGARAESEQYSRPNEKTAYNYYQAISVQMGTDAFREAMINAIIDKDYTMFPSQFAQYLSTIDNNKILNIISFPTIDKISKMNEIALRRNKGQEDYMPSVSVLDLRENAKKQRLPIIDKLLNGLKDMFGKNKNRDLNNNGDGYDER